MGSRSVGGGAGSGTDDDRVAYRWIDTEDDWAATVADLAAADRYAVDTEFHRERTYYPQLALLQIAWGHELVLVDPLAVDVAGFAEVLDGPGEAVMHAADQDMEVLEHAVGTIPTKLFDTQIAAGFAGYTSPSLLALCEGELGVTITKGDRLTDWLRRPLDAAQASYAASDVAHLFALADQLTADLEARGRLDWARAECEGLRTHSQGGRDPETAWLKIRDARRLKGRSRAIVAALAAWRERRAMARDQPVRQILSDMAVTSLAQRAPTSVKAMGGIRGLDDRFRRGRLAEEVLGVIADAADRPPPEPDGVAAKPDPELRPAVSLVATWLTQRSRELEIENALLGTRADIEALLAGDGDARLANGWRADLVGEPIRRLVAGRAALAFDPGGRVVLEARSGEALVTTEPGR